MFKLFNDVSTKMDNWYQIQKKYGVENMLEFYGGWMNIKKNRGGAMIIS